ncbi:MATE family efflux transporter [Paenibacillus sp. sgz5001063]|uniref:MATE family efflux transporter n=1 Tax=Paenibacillus sp. sgz5001063 TaxID=3242474 RepID=UPI0036D355BD
MIARSVSAGHIDQAKAVARQSAWISAIAGILFGLVTLFFAEPLLRLMGAEANVIQQGVVYFRIVAVPSVFLASRHLD